MSQHAESFIRIIKHLFKFRLFLFSKLPSAFFAGVRIRSINKNECEVTVPFKWFSQNPFRSTYFACLSMAAEMSTGALAMLHLHKRNPTVSMLVVKMESEFIKKAIGLTTFTCSDGSLIESAIENAISSGEPQSVRARSVGKNKEGEVVAEFFVSWSFKARNSK